MEFKSTTEKIVELRKKLKLKQYNFETVKFTRGYMALIESGRRNLSKTAAKVITERMRERIKELNLQIEIDDDYFLRTPSEDARKYCCEKMLQAKELSEDEINEIIEICEKYDLDDVQAEAFYIKGNFFLKNDDYINAYQNFVKSFSITNKDTALDLKIEIYKSLGKCRMYFQDYDSAIIYFNIALEQCKPEDMKEKKLCIIDEMVICNIKNKKYEEAINNISEYIDEIDKDNNFELYIKKSMDLGLLYRKVGDFNNSVSTYEHIIDYIKYHDKDISSGLVSIDKRLTSNEKELLGQVYTDIAITLMEQGNMYKALDFINAAENVRTDTCSKCLCHTLAEKASFLLQNEFYEGSKECAEKALKDATENEDIECIIKSADILYRNYEKTGDFDSMESILKDMIDVLCDAGRFMEAIEKTNMLIKLYGSNNDLNNIMECQNNIQKIFSCINNLRTN